MENIALKSRLQKVVHIVSTSMGLNDQLPRDVIKLLYLVQIG